MTASAPARRLVVEADGGSRGNPGVAGYGALVRDAASGRVLVELAEPLGQASNNVAEYSGLVAGLRAALDIEPGADVTARMDSKLVVEQMSGRWKIKHEDMRRLALEARDVCAQIRAAGGSVSFQWIPRDRNKDADALSNEGMDGNSVRRVHDPADVPGAEAGPGRGSGATGVPLRLLLVQVPDDAERATAIADAVCRLAGSGARVLAASGPSRAAVTEVAGSIAVAVGSSVEEDPSWTGEASGSLADEWVQAAYDGLRATGGTAVAVTTRRGVLTVLGLVLGLDEGRFWAIATAPGSLSAVEVWEDGTASVAFTNRTDHLG